MVVRGCVHGGMVVYEVRVVASPVVHGRADRAVPCALLLRGVGDAARDSVRRPSARSFVSVLRAGIGAGPATALGRRGRLRVGAGPGLCDGAHPAPRRARQGPACAMRAQRNRIHPGSRRASSA